MGRRRIVSSRIQPNHGDLSKEDLLREVVRRSVRRGADQDAAAPLRDKVVHQSSGDFRFTSARRALNKGKGVSEGVLHSDALWLVKLAKAGSTPGRREHHSKRGQGRKDAKDARPQIARHRKLATREAGHRQQHTLERK